MRRTMMFLLVLALLLGGGLLPATQTVQASDTAVLDTPIGLVNSGVTSFALAAPKVFWYTGVPQCPPGQVAAANQNGQYTELIQRIATYGSQQRTLYSESRNCNQGQVSSNIVADNDFLYWLAGTGLVKLSTNANPGDAPQLVNALVSGFGEVANASDRIYTINNTGGSNYAVSYVLKSNNQKVPLTTYGSFAGNLSTDGQYVYYVVNGNLIRLNPGVDNGITIATGVSGYYAEGPRLLFCTINPFHCNFSNSVYVAKGNQVFVYNNTNNTLGASPIYTSVDSTASIYSLVTDFSKLFLYESRVIPCSPDPCFASHSYVLNRTGRGGGAVDALYTFGPNLFSGPRGLTTDGTYLFWQENETVQRIANNASALPVVNLRVTGMEVTQGIQNLSNSVLLIKNRRTFVRVYVKSDGVAVSGVTAQLSSRTLESGPLAPVNPVGTHITVYGTPDRNNINQSFLFELPWNWTQQNSISLNVTLNPYKVPLEPNYADNVSSVNVSFSPSPKLSAEFYRLNYTLNGTTYRPRIFDDVLKTYSWIMRAYPIGGAIGDNFKPRLWDVAGGTQLGNWVNRSSADCKKAYPGKNDDVSLCASYYTNGWLDYYRQHGWVPNTHDFYYGMISDGAGFFPRGQAIYSQSSVGPSGTPCSPFSLGCGWDTDGSYADWYAGHEMGHTLGRAHPNAGSDNPATPNTSENCGHSRSDPGFPYGDTTHSRAPIGPADNSMEGFDVGDATFGIQKAVYPSSIWNDVMSYCSNQWLSDYTYKAMYNYMIAHPSAEVAAAGVQQTAVNGDFLSVAGGINPTTNIATFSLVRRVNSVVTIPPVVPGDYTIRLLDAQNQVLANTAFTPNVDPESGNLGFSQVVDFKAGTHTVQIVKTTGDQVLGSFTVSANPPVISNVTLQGATNPVSGTVTLAWNASDPDGDALVFDVVYSRDNGATFQPVAINLTGNGAQIDTAQLAGGSTAILRVTASDGVNTAAADTAPFVMANKPPQPYILNPENNVHIHYGQLVNFSGMAFDAQDGTVADSGLVWKNAKGDVVGTGALISLDNLPVGSNVITLVATNSANVAATTTVTVIVDDDLNLPGPTLTAGPAQIGWHVPAGATEAQTADVLIGNSGSGDVNWKASSDQPWLTLNVITGTVSAGSDPTSLTLTANPTGLPDNKTSSAKLTITQLGSSSVPTQTVVIPVTLSLGDIFDQPVQPAFTGNQAVYLPMITK